MRTRIRAFLNGAKSVFNGVEDTGLFLARGGDLSPRTPQEAFGGDARALRSDWDRVGENMSKITGREDKKCHFLNAGNNGDEIAVDPGDGLVFSLPEIPSSGYTWEFVELPNSFVVLKDSFEDEDFEPNPVVATKAKEDAKTGVAGGEVLRSFLVGVNYFVQPSARLELVLAKTRPWEAPSKDDQKYRVSVLIN